MGYDEPSSKRAQTIPTAIPAKRRGTWRVRALLLIGALAAGAYFASRFDSDDPIGALTALASDPMKAIDTALTSIMGETQKAGGGGPASATSAGSRRTRGSARCSRDGPHHRNRAREFDGHRKVANRRPAAFGGLQRRPNGEGGGRTFQNRPR